MRERETTIDDYGRVVTRQRTRPFEARVQFLVRFLTGRSFNRSSAEWAALMAARAIRDRCVHPKPPFEDLEAHEARQVVDAVRSFLIGVDSMMGHEPMPWLTDGV